MKTVLISSLFGILTIGAFVIVLLNRASEKILSAVIPITVAGLVGIFLSVFVFGGRPKVEVVFPSSVQYAVKTKMPANQPWALSWRRYHYGRFLPPKLFSKHPEYFSDPADSAGDSLYHHWLQRAIVDWLSERYGNSWQVESTFFELPTGGHGQWGPTDAEIKPGKVYSDKDIEAVLNGNKFSSVHSDMARQLSVPPNTDFSVEPPHADPKQGQIGKIRLKNKFCEISITTQQSSFLRGMGELASLAGLSEEESNRFGTATYRVRISISYSRFLAGHPDMAMYSEWTNGIADGIQKQFDEQIIWSNIKSDYMFHKQVEKLGPLQDR